MKTNIIKLVAFLMIAGFAQNLMAQTNTEAETTTDAGAVLIVAMMINQTSDLHFGSILLDGATGGFVVMDPETADRATDGLGGVALSAATPLPRNAAYGVTGTADETYFIDLPTTVTVTHINTLLTGELTMDITNWTSWTASEGVSTIGTLDGSGNDDFKLGGKLTIKSDQVGGIYYGTFDVTVDYN